MSPAGFGVKQKGWLPCLFQTPNNVIIHFNAGIKLGFQCIAWSDRRLAVSHYGRCGALTLHYDRLGLHTSLWHVGLTHVITARGAYTRHYGTWGLHTSLWHAGPRVERGTLYTQTCHTGPLKATNQTFLFMSGFIVPSCLASLYIHVSYNRTG